jgi:hypothetical protein
LFLKSGSYGTWLTHARRVSFPAPARGPQVPEWTHISHNLILNGPTIGHTSSLFPFIDNDDVRPAPRRALPSLRVAVGRHAEPLLPTQGSAYFSAVGNVGIYGGGASLLASPPSARAAPRTKSVCGGVDQNNNVLFAIIAPKISAQTVSWDPNNYFSAARGASAGKNYLGHDKRWADNLIIFPDHWAGKPATGGGAISLQVVLLATKNR